MSGEDRYWKAQIPIVMTVGSEDRTAEVVKGLEAAGATLEQLGRTLGHMMQGKAIDEHGDEREGVTVQPKEQLQALRLAAELQGLITKKTEQKNETVTRIRMEREQGGSGEIAGIAGSVLRKLSGPARDELIKLMEAETHVETLVDRSGS